MNSKTNLSPLHLNKDKEARLLRLTTFTDPMMGLSYESEPVMRKIETHFAGQVEFRYTMGVLVRDVHDFMIPEDYASTPEQSIRNYNKRLAAIYKQEEEISGMPIVMQDFRLFDAEHTTSRPLCLAFKAVQRVMPEKAEQFLYRLRFATIVETRPTTHREELLRVVRQTGIDEGEFLAAYTDGRAEAALQHDLYVCQSLGIRGLPAHILHYGRRHVIVPGVADYNTLTSAISTLTDGAVQPQSVTADTDTLRALVARHPLISPIEVSQAFDLYHPEDVKQFIQPLIDDGTVAVQQYAHGLFIVNQDKQKKI